MAMFVPIARAGELLTKVLFSRTKVVTMHKNSLAIPRIEVRSVQLHPKVEMRTILLVLVLFVLPFRADAAETSEVLFDKAVKIYSTASTGADNERFERYKMVREVLDQIVNEYPASDLAVQILLSETIEGLDIAALDAFLNDPASDFPPELREPGDTPVSETAVGTELGSATESENVIPTDPKERIRLTQENLNRVGCKVGAVDGVVGANTRRGHANYLREMKLSENIYSLGSSELLSSLLLAEGTVCETPPPIRLTTSNVSGTWSYASTCGPSSRLPNMKITGFMRISHQGGNSYAGPVSNSQGLKGKFKGRLQGRRLIAEIYWGFLFGTVKINGTIADQALVIHGRDSNRCRFTARKR